MRQCGVPFSFPQSLKFLQRRHSTMTLPSKYQNGSIDSALKGVYRASPVKLMIYGRGEFRSCHWGAEAHGVL